VPARRTEAPSLVAPWQRGRAGDTGFPEELLERPVLEAARGLLGCRLVSTIAGERAVVVIVETEAYGGPDDPASHAATTRGPTPRNRVMFGLPGRAYVYRSYGVHWCMNVVTGAEGVAQAVLIRGVEPLEGEAVMSDRRRGATPLGAGPGRLTEALAITDELYGHDLREPPLRLVRGWCVPDETVGISPRVGVGAAVDWPYRFFVRGSAGVSRPEAWGAQPRKRGSPASVRG
jgi:DNA-3-methyladenine glycosylase